MGAEVTFLDVVGDPVLVDLSDAEFRALAWGVAWCRREGTTVVPAPLVKALRKQRAVEELTRKGVWAEDSAGYHSTYFLAADPSEARLERRRAADRKRKHDARKSSGHSADSPPDVRGHSKDAPRTAGGSSEDCPQPVPPSHTLPSPDSSDSADFSESSGSDSGSEDLEACPREAAKPKRRAPKVAIPVDWAPNENHRARCLADGVDCDAEAARFRAYHEGKDTRWVDWDKAFWTWLRSTAPKVPAAVAELECPRGLAADMRAELGELSRELGAPLESVQREAVEFVRYWTQGAGKGTRRAAEAWRARCRQRVLDQAARGLLVAPGAIEHARHGGRLDGSPGAGTVAPSPLAGRVKRDFLPGTMDGT